MSIKFFYNFCLKEDNRTALDSDILSGVRRGYFSSFGRIKDRITINSDGDSVTYDFSIEKDKPVRWLVKSADGVLLQDSAVADGGKYYIYYYQDQAVYKRLLFSRLHTLLQVEYFDHSAGSPYISLEPRKAQTGLCILYTSHMTPQPLVVFPEPEITDDLVRTRMESFDDYTVIASTNDGIIRFLSDQQLTAFKTMKEQVEKELEELSEVTFVGDGTPLFDRLKAKDFNVKRNLSTALDITRAEEFSYAAGEADTTEEDELPAVESEDIIAPVEEAEVIEEITASEPQEEVTDTATEDTVEAEAEALAAEAAGILAQAISGDSDMSAENSTADTVTVNADSTVAAPGPDKLITADGAVYRYYGELDDQGNRSGFGRTMTQEGHTAYEGMYLHDKRSGKGSYFYKDGSLCYAGDWVENARHGVGVGVSSQDGSMHVGRWSQNKPVGSGVRLSAEGEIKFVCKELSDGTTVLMNYMPDDTVVIAKYDEKGKKLGEKVISFIDILQ